MQWEGDWSDSDAQPASSNDKDKSQLQQPSWRVKFSAQITAAFGITPAEVITVDRMDGEFFMSYEDWCKHFTHLFVGIDFPTKTHIGQRAAGRWDIDAGGNRQVSKDEVLPSCVKMIDW